MGSLREDEVNSDLEDSDVDDIDEFGDSGEDWTPEVESESRRKRPTRNSQAVAKKKRKRSSSFDTEEEDPLDEDEEDDDGVVVEVPIESDQSITIPPIMQPVVIPHRVSTEPNLRDIPREFHSGNFIILKKDVKWEGDSVITKLSDLTIWKIDGKALLQKFVAFDKNDRTYHKATCVYSGWNPESRDKYYPVSQLLDRNPRIDTKEVCVALDINDLIKVKNV